MRSYLAVDCTHRAGPQANPRCWPSATWSPAIPTATSGRRLALARWISHPENALTARTIANRIWMWHFGQPIAGNPNNFGGTGKRPTHPELLDWLAAALVENKWSIKSLHRLIMNSAAYRRSSTIESKDADRELMDAAICGVQAATTNGRRDARFHVGSNWRIESHARRIPNRPEINHEAALQPRQSWAHSQPPGCPILCRLSDIAARCTH